MPHFNGWTWSWTQTEIPTKIGIDWILKISRPLMSILAPQLPDHALENLERADRLWSALRSPETPDPPQVIHRSSEALSQTDLDVVICGGTLGILLGAALARRGWRVALLEKGVLKGREQEWNISAAELQVFLELDLLTEAELEQVQVTHYNPARIGFNGGPDLWVRDVLNIGVDPVALLELLKERFLQAGGILVEQTPFVEATVHPNGVAIETGDVTLTPRMMVDAMGHFSSIVGQARGGGKPDGVCLVVGSCAGGLPESETGDLIYTFTPIRNHCQYFWEAFPARDGRTTYLFTYLDAHPDRLSLRTLFEDYLELLPQYQGADLEQIQFHRTLFGFFPAYRQSPLQMPWDRILPVGDSSGSQSPLSFGGFGAMVRHLTRLDQGIDEALKTDQLDHQALALLQPYQPNLSVTWLFQQAMSVDLHHPPEDPNQINHLLSTVFAAMMQLGDPVAKPFLQDVVQFSGLTQTLLKVMISDPVLVAGLIRQLGPWSLISWMAHFSQLGLYSLLYPLGLGIDPLMNRLPDPLRYGGHRWIQAWKYGSGGDFHG